MYNEYPLRNDGTLVCVAYLLDTPWVNASKVGTL